MKIDILSNYFYPETGAAPNRIYNLAKGLLDLGHDVEVIAPLPNYPQGKIFKEYKGKFFIKENIDGIKVRRHWIYPSISSNPVKRGISMFSFAVALWRDFFHLRKRNASIVIIQNSPLFVSFSGITLYSLLKKTQIALNISDLWPLSALELGALKKGRLYNILEKIEKINYKRSDLIIGQSNEILTHVNEYTIKPQFLYRNISSGNNFHLQQPTSHEHAQIVYAGLLGVAQGVFEICKNIDFAQLGVEFHIYGDGNERNKIEEYVQQYSACNIFYHGSLPKNELYKVLPHYYAAIIPLKTRIYGAVPSKIFETASLGLPVLFCGGGEGAEIVKQFELGLTSPPGDYQILKENIQELKQMEQNQYWKLKKHCNEIARNEFNFSKQINSLDQKLKTIVQK
ncbi:MAG: glycosyltransferase family 4 protein [Bacteroidales bacterium]